MTSNKMTFQSWCVLLAVGILVFILNIDYTAVNLTLIPIAEEIETDLNTLQWLLSAYVLVWAALVIPAGKIADIYGNSRALIGGLLIFMGGSVLTGLGHTIEVLVLGRVLQGIGAAMFSAPAWATTFSVAPPERQGFVMGIIMSFAGLGLAIGPTLSGFVIENFGWRWIFYINIPLSLVIIAMLLIFGPAYVKQEKVERLSFLGTALLVVGLCGSIFGLNQLEVWGLHDLRFWLVTGLGVAFLSAFWLWNRSHQTPMIPKEIFANKSFVCLLYGTFVSSVTFSMILVLVALYLQNTLKYSTYETGLIFIAMTISMGLLSPLGGKLIDKFGVQKPMVLGAVMISVSTLLMAGLSDHSSIAYVCLALFAAGTGLGCYFTAGNTAMLWAASAQHINVSSGVYMMYSMVGNTLSVILSTSLVVLFGRNYLMEKAAANGMVLDANQHQVLSQIIAKVEHSKEQLVSFDPLQQDQLLTWIDQSFVHGMRFNFLGAFVFLVILIFWVRKVASNLKAPQSESAQAPVAVV